MSDRRGLVPFDPQYFEKQGGTTTLREKFSHVYATDLWSGDESASGAGSSRDQTATLEAQLPELLRDLGVEVLLDVPCGDYAWMQYVELPVRAYVGGDIVAELVDRNRRRYGDERRRFEVIDLTTDPLPNADLLLCRDALVHLSFDHIFAAFQNIRTSGIEYFLATTFPECSANEDIVSGDWRLLNLELEPFDLPPPIRLVNEGCTEGGGTYRDKSLGLWKVGDLR